MTQRYFATTTPGLEEALLAEVRAIGGRKATVLEGGVEFEATNKVFYRANLELRTANRVRLRVDEFRARDAPELYRKTRRFGWERLLASDNVLQIRATARESHLYHTDKIAGIVADAIRDRFAEDLEREPPRIARRARQAVEVFARLDTDRCELNLDASGEILHKRGYREKAVAAPIRETTAAAILHLLEHQPGEPVLDPMCGSGTFAIEAALRAASVPAGTARDFAFHRWANFRPELWKKVVDTAESKTREPAKVHFGFDRDPASVEAARHNANSAGVDSACTFDVRDLEDLEPPPDCPPGLVVTNPPYGERLDAPPEILATLLDRFADRFQGWRLGFVVPAQWKPSHDALQFEVRAEFKNGAIPVRLWHVAH